MYKSSSDRRFQKNKKEIRQAFIRLVMKNKGYHNISISEIAKEADINRIIATITADRAQTLSCSSSTCSALCRSGRPIGKFN